MFPGAYSTDFYRALAAAIHVEVRGGATGSSGSSDATYAWDRVNRLLETARFAEVA
jgi:hypothetical protein